MRIRILYTGMRRILAIVIFATAAAGATAAGAGVVVAPHIDPPGTPLFHTHALAAYRLPIFLGVLRAKWDPKQGLASTIRRTQASSACQSRTTGARSRTGRCGAR